jgi:hypothetical protein
VPVNTNTRTAIVDAQKSSPSGLVSAAHEAPSVSRKSHERRWGSAKRHAYSQRVTKKLNIAVSSPELVHARNVRLVSVAQRTSPMSHTRNRARSSFSRILRPIAITTRRVPKENTSERMFEDCGGSIPKIRQTRSITTTHKKLEYPSTGRKGGGFQTYPYPKMLLLTYRNEMNASSVRK